MILLNTLYNYEKLLILNQEIFCKKILECKFPLVFLLIEWVDNHWLHSYLSCKIKSIFEICDLSFNVDIEWNSSCSWCKKRSSPCTDFTAAVVLMVVCLGGSGVRIKLSDKWFNTDGGFFSRNFLLSWLFHNFLWNNSLKLLHLDDMVHCLLELHLPTILFLQDHLVIWILWLSWLDYHSWSCIM